MREDSPTGLAIRRLGARGRQEPNAPANAGPRENGSTERAGHRWAREDGSTERAGHRVGA
jgi:hypothetical protein